MSTVGLDPLWLWMWPLSSGAALVVVVLLLVRAWGDWLYLTRERLNGERAVFASGEVRRGLFYSVILIGNTAVGAGAALGLPILDVPPLTGLYAFLGSAAFGLEAWLELRDLGRLERVRAEKEKDAAEKERLGHTRRSDDVPKGDA